MTKLYRARSLLYRRQILQENIRWKALDEIYKVCMLLHRLELNISAKFRQTSLRFSAKYCKNTVFFNISHQKFDEKNSGISPNILANAERIIKNFAILEFPNKFYFSNIS